MPQDLDIVISACTCYFDYEQQKWEELITKARYNIEVGKTFHYDDHITIYADGCRECVLKHQE